MLEVGELFPPFQLPNQSGETKTLDHYAGKWLILYVYPKDDTPGCTVQGKSFTATKEDFANENAVVVGLNPDNVDSHKAFCEKYNFTIDLLSDGNGKFLDQTGVGQKTFKGHLYWNRTTFVIDPRGKIQKIYNNVNPEGHEQEILKDLKELKKK
jgi:peroxiredoxin Q/BCP